MSSLTLINLANHPLLGNLPALNGVPNLRSLTLGSLPLLQIIPVTFNKVSALSQLVLFDPPRLKMVPDMAPLTGLALIKPAHLCCNGFLNECDTVDPFCAADSEINITEAECINSADVNSKATEASRAVFHKFAATTFHQATYLTGMADSPTKERTDMCRYTFFKQCEFPPGMCMPYRMRVLSCTPNEAFMKFRRWEISELGMPWNPAVESWLVCTADN